MENKMSIAEIKAVAEALIFVSEIPLSLDKINDVLNGVERAELKAAILQLQEEYEREKRSLQIIEVANGFKMCTKSEYADYITKLLTHRRKAKLSAQALETLAVIAYRQPVTKPDIEEIRGVNTVGVLKTLLDRNLIKIMGKKEAAGRPILYGTTREFLEYFGLKNLSDLPTLKDFSEFDLGEIKTETNESGETSETSGSGESYQDTEVDIPDGNSIKETGGGDDTGGESNA